MDISYMSHVLELYRGRRDETRNRKALARAFRLWIDKCDPRLEHVVFGTDWTMVGQEAGSFDYTRTIIAFMQDEVGLDETQLQNLLSDNALRYLGLVQGEKTLERVIDFYDGNEQLISRLRRFVV